MIAKLAFLTTPAPGVFVLNIQPTGSDELLRFEISKAHLANVLVDGTALVLREQMYRVPFTTKNESANDRAEGA